MNGCKLAGLICMEKTWRGSVVSSSQHTYVPDPLRLAGTDMKANMDMREVKPSGIDMHKQGGGGTSNCGHCTSPGYGNRWHQTHWQG